jgi:phosphoribosylformylglycinamidine synthase II
MPCRVEVGLKPGLFDARGERTKKQILHAFPSLCEHPSILCIDVYNIDSDNLDDAVLAEAFCDPVIQEIAVNEPLSTDFDWYIEIGYRPGVTDNVGHSGKYTLKLITGKEIQVYSARAYLIKGAMSRELATTIARECLSNSLIQNFRVLDPHEILTIEPYIPVVDIDHEPQVEHLCLEVADEDLIRLSQERTLALSVEEIKTISSYLNNPQILEKRSKMGLGSKITDVELECLAQTWSEHCKHKIFNAEILYEEDGLTEKISSLFKTYIQKSTTDIRQQAGKDDICVSVFTDNAGVIRFNDEYNIVYKVETHNSPSALDPYGGALTGIVGVNRDPFGTGIGSKLIFNTDVFCFADPFYSDNLPPKILHPIRIFEGVREGVEHGGNKSGIPTVNGCIVFDNRYLGKPLVYCGTAGIMPARINGRASHEKHIASGDLIVMSGGRIGKDGIHGATFSSEELHEASPTSAVQIGDPITQKKLTDFLLRARDKNLYRAITDNGAGGLSSSVGEMAQLCGGCRIELDKPLLKYQGLSPWEILLSEAQERMTLAVPREQIDEFLELSKQMDVESTVIGEFNNSGYFHCTHGDVTVAYIELDFLHNGLPEMKLSARWEEKFQSDPATPVPDDHNEMLGQMLSRLNICSKEYVIRQYDHEVQGGSVIKPLVGKSCDGPSDAAVIRPILESNEGIVVSNGIIPRYSDIDTYHMTASALDEALRNYICVGGDPHHWACLDNFCWCDPITSEKNPDGAYKLAQLVRSNKALFTYTKAFNCPLISGKDSMKNDYVGPGIKISIPPTILISVIGKINDSTKAVSMDVKQPGHHLFILGPTKKELGGSEYFASFGMVGSSVPKVDAHEAMNRYEKIHTAITNGIIAAAHDISDGGLAVSLAEMAFAGDYGLKINLGAIKTDGVLNDTEILYSETPSRIIIAVSPENAQEIEHIFGKDAQFIGTSVEEKRLTIVGQDQNSIIDQEIQTLKKAWKEPLDL